MTTTTEKIPSREWLLGFFAGYYFNNPPMDYMSIKDESRQTLWEYYKQVNTRKRSGGVK